MQRLEDRVRRLELRVSAIPPSPAAVLPSFAASGSSGFDTPSTPVILDNNSLGAGSIDFSTDFADTFSISSRGRVQILRPGMYVIGCQINVVNPATVGNDTYVYMSLQYRTPSREVGWSIEIPYLQSGFENVGLLGEEVIGTRYVYLAGDNPGHDVCLQRLHPISLVNSTFPVEIAVQYLANWDQYTKVQYLAIWGFRVSDSLSNWFSD